MRTIQKGIKGLGLSVAVAALLSLSACGGSSSSGSGGGGIPPGGGGTVSGTPVSLTTNADWVAYQDGSGSWTQLSPTTPGGDNYLFGVTDSQGRYGIAVHRTDASGTNNLEVLQATTADMTSVSLGVTNNNSSTGIDNVTVSNLTSGDSATLDMPFPSSGTTATADGTVAVNALYGTDDLVAMQYDASNAVVNCVIDRGVSISSTAATSTVDFSSANALTPTASETYSVTGGTGSVSYVTDTGASALVSDGAGNYSYITGKDGASTDLYGFVGGNTANTVAAVKLYSATTNPGALTLDLSTDPSFVPTVSITDITGLTYAPGTDAPPVSTYATQLSQGSNVWTFIQTPNWLGTATGYAIPTFDTVSGYNTGWDLVTGTQVDGLADVYMLSGMPLSNLNTVFDVPPPPLTADTEEMISYEDLTFTP